MRANRSILGLGLGLGLAGACTTGCGPTEKSAVTGALILPRPAAGKTWGVALSRDGSAEGVIAQAGGVAGPDLRIPYQLAEVPRGSYVLVAWVDEGAGADDADSHQVGDLLGVYSRGGSPTFVLDGPKARGDIYLQEEAPESYPDVSGTVTLPRALPDRPYHVFIDTSSDGDDGYVDVDSGLTGDKAEINYRISNVKPGRGYFVYAWVDANENDEVDDGDLLGYYGATAGLPPARGGLDLPMPAPRGDAGDVDVDIQAAPVARVLSGSAELPEGANGNGSSYKIFLDDDDNPLNGAKLVKGGKVPRSGSSFSFQVPNVPAGKYYVAALVDNDGDGEPSKGDLWGYYYLKEITSDRASNAFEVPEADGTLPLGKLSVVKAVLRGTIDAGAEAARQRFQLRVSASSFAERFSDLSAAQGVLDESGKGEYLRVNPPVGAVFVQASAYSPADSPAMHPLVGEHFGFAGSDDAAPPASPTQLAPEGGELNFKLVKVSSIVRGKLADRSGGQPCTLAISSQAGSLSAGLLRRYHDKGCAADSFAAYNLPLSSVFFTFWQDDDGDGVSNAGDHLGYFNADTTQSPPAPPSTGFTATDGREVTGIDIESFEVK